MSMVHVQYVLYRNLIFFDRMAKEYFSACKRDRDRKGKRDRFISNTSTYMVFLVRTRCVQCTCLIVLLLTSEVQVLCICSSISAVL